MMQRCSDPVVLDMWHPVAATVELAAGVEYQTRLLGEPLSYAMSPQGLPQAWRGTQHQLPVMHAYGVLWTSLGSPPDELFEFDEFHEPDRHNVWAGSVGVHTSAPRAVAHFPARAGYGAARCGLYP